MTPQEHKDKFKQVAKFLKIQFDDLYDHGGQMIDGDGITFWIRYSGHSKKDSYVISASHKRSNEIYLSEQDKSGLVISCAHSKSPEKIASDIRNRLFPSIGGFKKKVLERLKEKDAYKNAKNSFKEKVLEELGEKDSQDDTISISIGGIYGSMQVNSDTCYLNLRHLNLETTLKILKVLKGEK